MNRLIRRAEVEYITGLSRSSIYAMMGSGKFPRPVRLGEKAVGWPSEAIETWVETRPCL